MLAKLHPFLAVFGASLLASLSSLPILVFHFGTFSLASPLASAVLSPVVALSFPLVVLVVIFPKLTPLLFGVSLFQNFVLEVCNGFGCVHKLCGVPLGFLLWVVFLLLAVGILTRFFSFSPQWTKVFLVFCVSFLLFFKSFPEPPALRADGFLFWKRGNRRVFFVWDRAAYFRLGSDEKVDLLVLRNGKWPALPSSNSHFVLPAAEGRGWDLL
jgi:hypothetical protein